MTFVFSENASDGSEDALMKPRIRVKAISNKNLAGKISRDIDGDVRDAFVESQGIPSGKRRKRKKFWWESN
jgi:hypothetical protein